jgi:hypothetical protein
MSDPASSAPDPVLHAITQTNDASSPNPLSAMNAQARTPDDQTDSRDQLLEGGDQTDQNEQTEQTYSAPSAPLLPPPVENDPEAQATTREDAMKAQSIHPLG